MTSMRKIRIITNTGDIKIYIPVLCKIFQLKKILSVHPYFSCSPSEIIISLKDGSVELSDMSNTKKYFSLKAKKISIDFSSEDEF